MFGPMVRANRLMRVGVEAEATILSLTETGSSLQVGGSIPKAGVRLELEIRPEGQPALPPPPCHNFHLHVEAQKYQPGSIIRVKYDPADPTMKGLSPKGRRPGTLPIHDRRGRARGARHGPSAETMAEFQKMTDGMVAEQKAASSPWASTPRPTSGA